MKKRELKSLSVWKKKRARQLKGLSLWEKKGEMVNLTSSVDPTMIIGVSKWKLFLAPKKIGRWLKMILKNQPTPQIGQMPTWKPWKKDKATLYILYQAVDESGFEKIANAKSQKKYMIFWRRHIRGMTEWNISTFIHSGRAREHEDEWDWRSSWVHYSSRTIANQLAKNREMLPASRVLDNVVKLIIRGSEREWKLVTQGS